MTRTFQSISIVFVSILVLTITFCQLFCSKKYNWPEASYQSTYFELNFISQCVDFVEICTVGVELHTWPTIFELKSSSSMLPLLKYVRPAWNSTLTVQILN